MAYDSPDRLQYLFKAIDFGASTSTQTIQVPVSGAQGRAGRVVGVILSDVSEDFAGSTTDAGVQVGDGTDADKYFDSGLVLDETVDINDNATLYLTDDGAQVDIELGRSTVTVTFVAAAGTPTGIADVSVVIDWF